MPSALPIRHLPPELSNRPAATSVAGFADKAVLTVLRPDTLENYTALSYKVHAVLQQGCMQTRRGEAGGSWPACCEGCCCRLACPCTYAPTSTHLPPSQVELYDKAGNAIAGAQPVVPSEVTGTGTIYNPASLTLTLRHAGRGQCWWRIVV